MRLRLSWTCHPGQFCGLLRLVIQKFRTWSTKCLFIGRHSGPINDVHRPASNRALDWRMHFPHQAVLPGKRAKKRMSRLARGLARTGIPAFSLPELGNTNLLLCAEPMTASPRTRRPRATANADVRGIVLAKHSLVTQMRYFFGVISAELCYKAALSPNSSRLGCSDSSSHLSFVRSHCSGVLRNAIIILLFLKVPPILQSPHSSCKSYL